VTEKTTVVIIPTRMLVRKRSVEAQSLHVKMGDVYHKPGHVIKQMIVETIVMKVQLRAPHVQFQLVHQLIFNAI